jgi:hypothetical protein
MPYLYRNLLWSDRAMYGNIKLIHVKMYLYGTLCVSVKKELALPHTCIYIELFTISFEKLA